MRINVIGLGYIGLPTAAVFAHSGAEVVGVDKNERIVSTINDGNIHIEEPGLLDVIREVVGDGRLRAALQPCEADVFIVAVPTPNECGPARGCDLSFVLSAVKSVIPYLKKGNTLIVESTIAPRTMEDHIAPLVAQAGFTAGQNIFLAHCPERVLPGNILHELTHNNRIVGGLTPACADRAADIYSLFVRGEIIKTEAKTAEMSKLVENTFRDVNIALANELAKICCELKINVLDVIAMANKHPRVNIHAPGAGVGGHCIAVDPYFIYAEAPGTARMIKLARDINSGMPDYVVSNVAKLLKGNEKAEIAVFGVAYKPNVDDTRESPALQIIEKLAAKGYRLRIHDPHMSAPEYVSLDEALLGADMLLCLVGHNEFKQLDSRYVNRLMNQPLVFDVSGVISNVDMQIINYGNLYDYIDA